jgi:hypothetical protein
MLNPPLPWPLMANSGWLDQGQDTGLSTEGGPICLWEAEQEA